MGPRERWLGRALLVGALVVASIGMRPSLQPGPFRDSWLGHNGARYALIARNYLRDGLLAQRGAPRLDPVASTGDPDVYGHHPPGVALLVAAVFALAGPGETPARGVPAAATLLALWLLARSVGRVAGPRAGGTAALLCAALPMTTVYGAHLDVQGPPVLAASLGVVLAYARWREGASVVPVLLLATLASACDWYGLYAPALCALHLLATERTRGGALALLGFTLALFLLWVAWLVTLPGMSLERFAGAVAVRGPGTLRAGGPEVAEQLAVWWRHSLRLIPAWPALLVLAAAVIAGRLGVSGRPGPLGPRGLVVLLVLPPVLHALLFPAGALVHSYWLFGLPTGLAAALALALQRWHLGLSLAAAAALALAGATSDIPTLPDAPDELPARVGELLAEHTAPGDVVLTTYDCNPLVQGAVGDRHVTKRPAVTWYADRAIRGLPRGPSPDATPTAADLVEALTRRPDARWLLTGPWPQPPQDLLDAARGRSLDGGRLLHEDPPVWLFRLTP